MVKGLKGFHLSDGSYRDGDLKGCALTMVDLGEGPRGQESQIEEKLYGK